MMSTAALHFLTAARVPSTLEPQVFGPWTIERRPTSDAGVYVGWPDYTLLRRHSLATIHRNDAGAVVMEDSVYELRKHLPIWLTARGRVLVTGLGLGCVVRGLLASPEVDHIDVVEIDQTILSVVGREFEPDPRVTLHLGDALSFEPCENTNWDFAWHDLWEDGTGDSLQVMHFQLLMKFYDRVGRQGAWAFPRQLKRVLGRRIGDRLLGLPRFNDISKSRKEAA